MNSNSNCLTVIRNRKKRKETTIKGLRKIFLLTDMFYLCNYRSDININITVPHLFMLMMMWSLISRCDPLWPPKNQGRTARRHAPNQKSGSKTTYTRSYYRKWISAWWMFRILNDAAALHLKMSKLSCVLIIQTTLLQLIKNFPCKYVRTKLITCKPSLFAIKSLSCNKKLNRVWPFVYTSKLAVN
jgi:hypothetical protein